MTTQRSLAMLAVAVLVIGAGVGLYATRTQAPPVTLPAPTTVPSASALPSPTASAPAGGSITGRFGYGADFIPAVTVYAIRVDDPKVFFSVDFPGFGNPPRPTLPPGVTQPIYTITGVAPGTYHVIAYRNDGDSSLGVYSRHTVNCDQATTGGQGSTPAPGCPAQDFSLVPVTVRAGEMVSRVDITTWVFGPRVSQGNYPPRPTPAPATPATNGYFKWPCGTVTAYTAPTTTAAGSVSLGTSTFALARGSAPANDASLSVGGSRCVNGEQDSAGVFTQFSVSPMGDGICSTVVAYVPPSPGVPGSLDFGTPKPPVRIPVALGVTFTAAQVTGDQCFRVTPDAQGTAQVTAYMGPRR